MKEEDYETYARLEYERAIQAGLPDDVALQLALDSTAELAADEIRRILPGRLGETIIEALRRKGSDGCEETR